MEKVTSKRLCVEKRTGKAVVKNESKSTSKIKIDNKNGYFTKEKVSSRRVKCTGQVGVNNDSKRTSAIMTGSKTGYTTKKKVSSTELKVQDKKSGSYGHYTTKEKVSSRELRKEKPTGRVGVKTGSKIGCTTKEKVSSRKLHVEDKKSGSYGNYSTNEMVLSGELYAEQYTVQVGVKNGCNRTSTITTGSKTGYTTKGKASCLELHSEDKKSGSYGHYTTKEKLLSGELHVEKHTGKVGVKNESNRSSTIKIGNKTGYTEYYTEERVSEVKFNEEGQPQLWYWQQQPLNW